MDAKKIENYLQEFKETFMSEKFSWRKGQKEAIIQIINAYYEKKYKYVILDAPVGSGKSIIAMATSWILNQNKKRGFILASDISLQDQYEKDFKSFNLRWGSVKGVDNYECIDNMEKHSLGTCKIRNIMPKRMSCYDECPYFNARDFASKSPTSLLNYAYWLIMMNYVNKHAEEEKQIFPPRNFLICDEAHKVLDIVQNHYSPRFDSNVLKKLEDLKDFFLLFSMKNHEIHYLNIKKYYQQLFKEEKNKKLLEILSKIENNLEGFLPSIDILKDKIKKEYPDGKPPKAWRKALRISDWLKDFHCKVEDYVYIIENTSEDNIIKNPQGDDELIFNCLEENYLMHKYFHTWSDFTIFMSATFSDPNQYLKDMALKGAKYIKVPSQFDFEKSPIHFYNQRRMSYREIDKNLPWLYEKINEIIDNHKSDNGIIHTASYHLTLKIHNNLSKENKKRILVYSGTEEKRKVLDILKRDKSKILMGPSLLEGLDLKNDWSRFQIFAKVPYLSLGDRFVKTKMDINPGWYQSKAIINILQGTGRSVRSEDDWAITYILDGSLSDLIYRNRKAFPIEFIQRLNIIRE